MANNLEQTVALLSRTPAALNALLRGLPDEWTDTDEGENTWTVYDIIGHLIHGEHTDWIPRVRRIFESGENRAFDKFDREAQFRESKGKSISELLDEFARLRAENMNALRELNLQPQDLDRHGLHPSLGPVTLGQLLSTWAAHDLTHLHQISRVMAYQYRKEVGPWSQYLGVMQCNGHSS